MRFKGNLFILTLFITVISLTTFGQKEPQKKFIQFVFTNLETPEKAHEIDNFIRKQPGVFISRCDIPSKKFLLIYYPSELIDIDKVDEWMEKFGMEYKCFYEGTHKVDPILDLKKDCNL